ncbi:MAG: hypothetical protein M0Z91_04030 [Actinomycetota bacterium]|nr:hypothetical protein [Actinomycetota bacterium]
MTMPRRVIIALAMASAVGLAGCGTHSSTLPPEGGSLGAKPGVGAGGTNAPALNGSSQTNVNAYDGAGFAAPSFPPTTIAGYRNGLPTAPATIKVEESPDGPVLASPQGKTLYMRLGDTPTHSGCFATCLLAFPPMLTNGAPQASGGILAGYLGVLTSADSGEQISYAGHPLYTYSGDKIPGQISAEGAGGIWFAVTPGGTPLRPPAKSASGSAG